LIPDLRIDTGVSSLTSTLSSLNIMSEVTDYNEIPDLIPGPGTPSTPGLHEPFWGYFQQARMPMEPREPREPTWPDHLDPINIVPYSNPDESDPEDMYLGNLNAVEACPEDNHRYAGRGFSRDGEWGEHRPCRRCDPSNSDAYRQDLDDTYVEMESKWKSMVRMMVYYGMRFTVAVAAAKKKRRDTDRQERLERAAANREADELRAWQNARQAVFAVQTLQAGLTQQAGEQADEADDEGGSDSRMGDGPETDGSEIDVEMADVDEDDGMPLVPMTSQGTQTTM
jgi:hypothetical protein